jgi:Uma2 family endonuclease
MATRTHHYYTPEEYLALERAAEYKSEYLDGVIYAMAGASEPHNIIASNINRHLGNSFEDRPCLVYTSDMKIRASDLYAYPDVVAVCGSREFADDKRDTLLNPTVIVEVLSPFTERYDREEKFDHYRQVPSLTDYVLVAQDQMRVEYFTRHPDGWLITTLTTPDAMLNPPSLGCVLSLAAIYKNVDFPPTSSTRGTPRPPRPRSRSTPRSES